VHVVVHANRPTLIIGITNQQTIKGPGTGYFTSHDVLGQCSYILQDRHHLHCLAGTLFEPGSGTEPSLRASLELRVVSLQYLSQKEHH